MQWTFLLVVGLLIAAGALTPVHATVQESQSCWVPDIEYPVPCDDEED